MKKILAILVILLCQFIPAQSNYYVAKTGDNANAGTLSAPWLEIQYAVNRLSPGDTLNIKAGTYEEKIDIDVSGAPNAYITIRNYQNDEVILDAINFTTANAIIWTDNAYLHIEGLHLTNNMKNDATGLEIQGAAHHIEFVNNKISNIRFSRRPNPTVTPSKNAVPLNIWGDSTTDSIHNILIKGNEIFNNMTGYSENLTGGGNFSHFIFENNIIHDNTNIGIDLTGNYGVCSDGNLDQARYGVVHNNLVYNCQADYSTAAGIYIDGGRNIIIENNTSHHNGYGIEVGCEENGTTSNIIVRNNLCYDNADAGIAIGGYDTATTGKVVHTKVYGNTFYKNDAGNNYNGEILLTLLDDCHMVNNIFYTTDQAVLLEASRTQTAFSFDYNLIYQDSGSADIVVETAAGSYDNLADYYSASGQGAHHIFTNPLFVDSGQNDFHLQNQSPAVDAGDPNLNADANEVDLDGQQRIYNNIMDCGVDEFMPAAVLTLLNNTSMLIYPNPAADELYITKTSGVVYTIYALNGQCVKTGKTHQSIDVSNLKKGIYLLQINNSRNQLIAIRKIIIN